MLDIHESTLDELLANASNLFEEHRLETAGYPDIMRVDPDVALYKEIETAGGLMIISAWDDGELVGYSVNVVHKHPHHKRTVVCANDMLFVTMSYRKKGIGLKLIRGTKRYAQERGAQMVLWHARPESALAKLLSKTGSLAHEIVFSERLDE